MRSYYVFLTLALLLTHVTTFATILTVNDGTTTNTNSPIYGSYASLVGSYCQSNIDASKLASMVGKEISELTFYTSSTLTNPWDGAEFEVRMASFTYSSPNMSAQPVLYQGKLRPSDGTIRIAFSTPYLYNGGRLRIEVLCVKAGANNNITFYGDYAMSGSVSSYKNTNWYASFTPKTTFVYDTPSSCPKVDSCWISNLTATSAMLHWTSNSAASGYIVELDGTQSYVQDTSFVLSLYPGETYIARVASLCIPADTGFFSALPITAPCGTLPINVQPGDTVLYHSFDPEEGCADTHFPACYSTRFDSTVAFNHYYDKPWRCVSGNSYSGSYHLYGESPYTIFSLPGYDLTTSDYMISFWANNFYPLSTIRVYLSATPNFADAVEIGSTPTLTNTYTHFEFSIPRSGLCYLFIYGYSTNYFTQFRLDDLCIYRMAGGHGPTGLHLQSMTDTSALFSWSPASETDTTYLVKLTSKNGHQLYNQTVADTSATITGLHPASSYDEYTLSVTAYDTSGQASETATRLFSFHTPCATAYSTWADNFEPNSDGSTRLPLECWTLINAEYKEGDSYYYSSDEPYAYVSSYYSNHLEIITGDGRNAYFTLPPITGWKQMQLDFDYCTSAYDAMGQLDFGYIADISNPDNTFVSLATYGRTYGGYTNIQKIRNVSLYNRVMSSAPDSARLAFRTSGSTMRNAVFSIDNISLTPLNQCVAPWNFELVTAQDSSATFHWNPGLSETVFHLILKNGSQQLADTIIPGTTFILNGLHPSTAYYVQATLTAVCGNDTSTPYVSEVIPFSTTCQPISSLPWSEDFSQMLCGSFKDNYRPACWQLSEPNPAPDKYSRWYLDASERHSTDGSFTAQIFSSPFEFPYIALPEATCSFTNARSSFWFKSSYAHSNGIIIVGYSTDMDNPADSFVALDSIIGLTTTWQEGTFDISAAPDSARIIITFSISGTATIWFDDFSIDRLNTCPMVEHIHTEEVLSSSIRIAWSPVSEADSYHAIIALNADSDFILTPDSIVVDTILTDTTLTISMLSPYAEYLVTAEIHTLCDTISSYRSMWQQLIVTAPGELTLPWQTSFEGAGMSVPVQNAAPGWRIYENYDIMSGGAWPRTYPFGHIGHVAIEFAEQLSYDNLQTMVSPKFADTVLLSNAEMEIWHRSLYDLPNVTSSYIEIISLPQSYALDSAFFISTLAIHRQWEKSIIRLSNVPATHHYLAIRHHDTPRVHGAGFPQLDQQTYFLDDIRVYAVPFEDALEDISSEAIHRSQKVLYNGQVLLIHNGKIYDIWGRLIK